MLFSCQRLDDAGTARSQRWTVSDEQLESFRRLASPSIECRGVSELAARFPTGAAIPGAVVGVQPHDDLDPRGRARCSHGDLQHLLRYSRASAAIPVARGARAHRLGDANGPESGELPGRPSRTRSRVSHGAPAGRERLASVQRRDLTRTCGGAPPGALPYLPLRRPDGHGHRAGGLLPTDSPGEPHRSDVPVERGVSRGAGRGSAAERLLVMLWTR